MNDDTITEVGRDIILLSDMDGNIRYVNAAGMERIGYFEDLLDMNIADILPPDQLEKIRTSLLDSQSIPSGEVLHHAELIDSSLNMIPTEIQALLIPKDGQPSEILLIARDHDDSDSGEKTPAAKPTGDSGDNYRQITEAVKEMLLTFDMTGKLTYMNEKGCELVGYFADELQDMNISDILSPDQAELLKKQLLTQPVSAKRKVVLPDAPFINRELNVIPLEITASLIIRDNRASEFLILARDLSRRKKTTDDVKQLQETIQTNQEKYRLIAEAIKELVLTFDMAGNITYVNPKGTEMIGYFEDELLDMNIADILPPDQLNLLRQNMLRSPINRNRKLVIPEVPFTDRELRPIPMEVTASLIIKGGKPSDILIMARDLTRRKRMEKEHQQSSH